MAKKGFSLFALVLFFAAVGVRLIALAADIYSPFFTAAFYLLTAAGVVMLALDVRTAKNFAPAFNYKNKFHLGTLSALCALGFFADFVVGVVKIFDIFVDSSVKASAAVVGPVVSACVFAFASCFYFVLVSLSFSSASYDFRKLRLLHIAPIFWSVSKVLGVLTDSVILTVDIDLVLKYAALVFCICTFYCFAGEAAGNENTMNVSVFVFRGMSFCGMLYFFDRIMLLFSKKAEITDYDGFLGITVLGISVFIYYFEKNIIAHSENVRNDGGE